MCTIMTRSHHNDTVSYSATPILARLHTKLDKLFQKKQQLTEMLRIELSSISPYHYFTNRDSPAEG